MRVINNVFLLFFLLSIGACKQVELPEPIDGDPVFSVNASLANQALNITAGVDDFYLFTSYVQDDLEVNSFIGRFAKLEDCTTDCEESLEFIIRDADIASNSLAIESSLSVGRYGYAGPVGQGDTVLLGYDVFLENNSTSNQPLIYTWDFGDNTTSNEQNPEPHFYPVNSGLDRVISLEVFANNSGFPTCFATESNTINLDQQVIPECELGYSLFYDSVVVEMCGLMSGIPPFTYEWGFDPLLFDSCVTLTNFSDSVDFQLTGVDAQGCSEVVSISLARDVQSGGLGYCSADFAYEVRERVMVTQEVDSLNLSEVIIRYTNPEGILFSTEFNPQPAESIFDIQQAVEYFDNENGEKTRQLVVSFSCTLYSADGDELFLQEGSGTIAVAHP